MKMADDAQENESTAPKESEEVEVGETTQETESNLTPSGESAEKTALELQSKLNLSALPVSSSAQ